MDLISEYKSDDEHDNGVELDDDSSSTASQVSLSPPPKKKLNTCTNHPFVRTVPHMDGNWSGLVSIRVPVNMDDGLEDIVRLFEKVLNCDFYRHESYHISLSKMFYLQDVAKDSWKNDLYKAIQNEMKFSVAVHISPCAVEILTNDELSRSFLTFPVVMGEKHIKQVIAKVDGISSKYQLPIYYENPKIHFSFASVGKEISSRDTSDLKKCPEFDYLIDEIFTFSVQAIECKLGTVQTFEIPLLST
mmetsp:Transcript_16840/g.21877  ORF Transcript_16840/g.21877 Transcript_16840/m.21877 type:complete len:246 (-) Transcript_16840:173-910(-)|eukprot:CAMPEP_0116063956 /NCGR_PEP_ID=MMETSP0322-20121206/8775_1 /TAXON_ID=163516 /ORGANISM="Leptocylindrus danicus var. apora, Strain B651" /LENGTH=245 /DNA_ID=CAMNT_0003549777 /DNA_START=437 /DNA_END=1174 /DNA_ORIENTATION=+